MKKIRLALLALLLTPPITKTLAEDWMGNIPDNTYVAALSIPGTHDTATANGWTTGSSILLASKYSETQSINFEAQWNLGIRAFDFRPKVDGSNLRCCHGKHETKLMFNDAMNSLADWLDKHPTEFAVIHLLYADGYDSDKDKYNTNLQNLMASDKLKDKIVDYRRDLTVGEMRGKILLLSRDEYNTAPMGGFLKNWCGYIDWNAQSNGWIAGAGSDEFSTGALYMQDLADTHEDGKKEEKVAAIRRMLDYSTTHYSTDPRQQVWMMNFASAYSKITTLAGNEISLSEGYKDNAITTNKAILDYLNDGSKIAGPTGIILMDYVGIDETSGNEVVKAIIDQNAKYLGGEQKPLLGQPVSFIKDENRDYTNKMNMGAKNFMPFIADFDGNGLMDVYFGGESYIYKSTEDKWDFADGGFVALNNGAGNYPAWNTQTDYTGNTIPIFYGAKARVAFDMDQDGDLDAIVLDNRTSGWTSGHPNVGYHSFRVIKNVDNGKRSEDITAQCGGLGDLQFSSDNNGGAGIHNIAVADVNMDGYPDILIQGETVWGKEGVVWERATKLFLNNGGNGFTLSDQFVGANSGSVLFGDFNCDGYPDVVISGYTQGDSSKGVNGGDCFLLYKNDGTGHFTLDQNLSSRYGKSGSETVMHVVDYDQDGKLDILIIGSVPQVGVSSAANGKIAFVLRNTSTGDGNISFEEVGTNIYPTSGSGDRTSVLADFNGDGFVDYLANGWGINNNWSNGIYASYSSGKDQYTTADNVTSDETGWMGFGDVDGDGMLDFMSPNNSDNGAPMFYRNTSLLGTNAQCEVPGAPTGIKAVYDKASKRLTLTWDKMMTSTGSKAIYNVYIVQDGKTYMRCPTVKATGKQTAYTSFGNYLPAETCFFDGIEPGVYEIGVQSVAYSWNASKFTTRTVAVLDENTYVDIPAQADNADVCITRTLKAGQWNSFCVPFSMTEAQIQAAGLGEVKAFSSTQLSSGSCILGFSDATAIEAGVPYMVRPAKDVTSFQVTGTALSAEDAGQTELTDAIFQGAYATQDALQGDDIYIISGNQFYQADKAVTMKGYRAYIRLKTTTGVNRLVFDDMTTGITTTDAAAGNDKVDVYTLSGMRVKENVNAAHALDGLRKGVYVVGRKKVVK